ncbi:hypothetical protein NQZ68_022710 [Dissostichus eleginoides]|nr:hypothetical protein NQZ68_022710 [Dissostichus eleginoides]
MQTLYGPPLRCDPAHSPWLLRCLTLPTGIHAFALHASTALSPVTVVRLLGSFRAPQVNTRIAPKSRSKGDD